MKVQFSFTPHSFIQSAYTRITRRRGLGVTRAPNSESLTPLQGVGQIPHPIAQVRSPAKKSLRARPAMAAASFSEVEARVKTRMYRRILSLLFQAGQGGFWDFHGPSPTSTSAIAQDFRWPRAT